MATFPTPSQILTQYLAYLKSIKPSLNTNDQNSDFVIRGKGISGLVSGLYGDQAKVNGDTFISSARPEALSLDGQDFALPPQTATLADSPAVSVPGTNGTIVSVGQLTFLYLPTGVLYTNTTGGTVASGTVSVAIQALATGQIGNVALPDSLQIVAPPSGIGTTANLIDAIADGADPETTDSYRARLLLREQSPPAGGNQTDYVNFAFAASNAVRSAFVRRFGRGLGTVDVYITTGTTNIDTAVTQGLSIVRIPSSTVLNQVQAYYNANVPLTDCPAIYAPTELDVPVTVAVDLAAGITMSTIPSDSVNNPLNLTVAQLIRREVGRPLYKLPVGGRLIPGNASGVVPAADIEQSLDVWLSAVIDPNTGIAIGIIPVLADRQVAPLNGAQYDLPIIASQLPAPGTVTITGPV